MRTDAEIMQIIDEAIQSIWKTEIKHDYDNNWIMNEDGLKTALYFHLSKIVYCPDHIFFETHR